MFMCRAVVDIFDLQLKSRLSGIGILLSVSDNICMREETPNDVGCMGKEEDHRCDSKVT